MSPSTSATFFAVIGCANINFSFKVLNAEKVLPGWPDDIGAAYAVMPLNSYKGRHCSSLMAASLVTGTVSRLPCLSKDVVYGCSDRSGTSRSHCHEDIQGGWLPGHRLREARLRRRAVETVAGLGTVGDGKHRLQQQPLSQCHVGFPLPKGHRRLSNRSSSPSIHGGLLRPLRTAASGPSQRGSQVFRASQGQMGVTLRAGRFRADRILR